MGFRDIDDPFAPACWNRDIDDLIFRLARRRKVHKPDVPLRPIVASRGSPTYETARFLTSILQPLVGNTPHHVSNSKQFVETTRNLTLQPTDIMVSFDVVSLFTNVPTEEACHITKERLDSDTSLADRTALSPTQIVDLIHLCTSSSYFQFQDKFYEQTAGTSMGSPISPVLANIFMEEFETSSLLTAELKPSLWLRYVDDTFVIWPHGQEQLQEFLTYLNKQHPTIKFTMEQEQDGQLAFLDVNLSRNKDGTLNHRVYRKPTHTDRYLHQRSFHHPAIKTSVNRTLVRRAHEICDRGNLNQELKHIKAALQLNGYKHINLSKPTNRTIGSPIPEVPPPPPALGSPIPEATKSPIPTVCLPFLGPASYQLRKILQSADIRVIHSAPNKLRNLLHTHKDKPAPNSRPGVYRIPCECGQVYIGETGRNLHTRLQEHRAHGRRGDYEKSAIIKHAHSSDHRIKWDNAELIAPIKHWHPRRVREAIEIFRHNTVPQDIGFKISDIWRPLLVPKTATITTRAVGSSIHETQAPLTPRC